MIESNNMLKGIEYCKKVKEMGADIAVFPEMWNNGYEMLFEGELENQNNISQEKIEKWKSPIVKNINKHELDSELLLMDSKEDVQIVRFNMQGDNIKKEKKVLQFKNMNILGDSITWGYNPITEKQIEKSYSIILKEKLNLRELKNYGINSSTLADNKKSYKPMCNRYEDMDNNADIVAIFGGTNDYGREDFGVKLGKINDMEISTIYGALNNMCLGLKQKYPNSVIFFITPLQRAYIDMRM